MDIVTQEIIILIIAGSGVVLGCIIFYLIHQKKQLHYLMEKKEMNNQFQKVLLKTRLEAREETLLKLSKEMHENIGQLLSSSKILIGVAERSLPNSSGTLLLADEALSKAIHELRTMSRTLNKDWLEKFDLIENVEKEIDQINYTQKIKVVFNHPERITLSGDRQLLLFRITQEALHNSLKHGKASLITITLSDVNSGMSMILTIEDNGVGFDPDRGSPGFGILVMQQHAQIMGGTSHWHSDNQGTKVTIQLPR